VDTTAPAWPADVIHVNEDGWVLINRGQVHGVATGLRLFVVGSGVRELRDLFPRGDAEASVVLRTRRTYELLEVVHVEERCAVAVAARAPSARRPEFYHGPTGELLVWVPLPDDYTWPPPPAADAEPDADDTDDEADDDGNDRDDAAEDEDDAEATDGEPEAQESAAAPPTDEPPGHGDQEDVRWEEALPLNGVAVGDIVIPAVPAGSLAPSAQLADTLTPADPGASPAGAEPASQPAWGQSYDWMQTKAEQ
jgi:hypothetical protein